MLGRAQNSNSASPFGRLPRLGPLAAFVALAMLLVLLGFSRDARASVGGSISGTITDRSGAAITQANVTVTNAETGIQQAVTTDNKGFYSFPALPIGRYDLSVSVTAFRPYQRTGIVIDANSVITVNVTLQVGDRSDAITVVEDQFQLQTSSTQNRTAIPA